MVGWDNVIIGLRQDISVEIFNSGVITDETLPARPPGHRQHHRDTVCVPGDSLPAPRGRGGVTPKAADGDTVRPCGGTTIAYSRQLLPSVRFTVWCASDADTTRVPRCDTVTEYDAKPSGTSGTSNGIVHDVITFAAEIPTRGADIV
ncbi:hypothetical protein [Amycolatopsis alkalitolerans]|uniref:Uncharacterized protein n=1 Tax=Amycolatopsis alkalitolerans TaxID=2547244 RepID=A0A5C4MAC3_9PSEU|nr:hypothetical protein [Amycolatopsis alkalitolerans]TNC29169.1 hypothetical protein FG385_03530 [Amycolatopsis alkalitolerans]